MSEKDCPVGLKEWLEYIKQKFICFEKFLWIGKKLY